MERQKEIEGMEREEEGGREGEVEIVEREKERGRGRRRESKRGRE